MKHQLVWKGAAHSSSYCGYTPERVLQYLAWYRARVRVITEQHLYVDDEGSLLLGVEHHGLRGRDAHHVVAGRVLDGYPHARRQVQVDSRQLTQ